MDYKKEDKILTKLLEEKGFKDFYAYGLFSFYTDGMYFELLIKQGRFSHCFVCEIDCQLYEKIFFCEVIPFSDDNEAIRLFVCNSCAQKIKLLGSE